MPFRRQQLVRLAGGAGSFSLWHYDAGEDGPDTVLAHNYFLEVRDWLNKGDRMMVTAANGERHFDAYVEAAELDDVRVWSIKSMFAGGIQDLDAVQRRNAGKAQRDGKDEV